MTDHDPDSALVRRAIGDLRAADEASAPSFGAVRARETCTVRAAGPSHARLLTFAASAVIAAGGLYALVSSGRPRLVVPAEVLALSTWQPATDALLETPGRALMRHAPRLAASVIELPITGDSR